jgi:hypothetical protein
MRTLQEHFQSRRSEESRLLDRLRRCFGIPQHDKLCLVARRCFILFPLAFLLIGVSGSLAQPDADSQSSSTRFGAVDVYIDPQGKALAAYQFELTSTGANVTLVGVEGGEHSAFAKPPYYDSHANLERRIVIAAFNIGTDLPKAKTRVARLMVHISGSGQAHYNAKLHVAASSEGAAIPATISVTEGTHQ